MRIILAALAACLFVCHIPAWGDFTFGEPTKVPNINSDFSDHSPQISRDGLELYFVSKRPSSFDWGAQTQDMGLKTADYERSLVCAGGA